MGVWQGVNVDLCLIFNNIGLNYNQNLGMMPMIQLVSMGTKSYISCCRHRILYPLQLGPPFPNDAQTLRPKTSLEPNQILN